MAIRINMLSKADSVPGQGVGSAYLEQTKLVSKIDDLDVTINGKGNDYDLVHIHSVNLRYKHRMNKQHPNIVYVHFVPSMNDGSIKLLWPFNKLFNLYVNRFYKRADELVVVNPHFIRPLLDLGIDKDNITYIPNYVDKDVFKPLEKHEIFDEKLKIFGKNPKFIVLGVGQVQTRKGFDDFIELARKNPDIDFLWAGGFSFGIISHGYRKYKKMIKNAPSNFKLLGIVDRDKMDLIYNIADVLFMPSHMELFPMAILEAASVHKPIVLRDLTLYKPILFDDYYACKNIEDFNKAINDLRDNSNLYQKYVDKSKQISDFYNSSLLKETWKNYYLKIYDKYKK